MGPIQPQHHYHIPPLERLDLDGVRTLIRQQKYFVLHAPRQTGKTSALLALLAGGWDALAPKKTIPHSVLRSNAVRNSAT